MGLAFVPLYVKFLGIESYGLIGIFVTIQTMFSVLDMGLSTTLNRELARLSALESREHEMVNLVRTLEFPYWGVAILIGMIVVAISPLIASHWINTEELSPIRVTHALMLMGLTIALQWPVSFYSGGIMGLQLQVLLNVITTGTETLRGIGAVLILWLVSPTIEAFFLWQIVIAAAKTGLLALFLWRRLPSTGTGAAFQKDLFKGIWRFASGMTGITLSGMLLTQIDKVVLSKMLSLETFGYYSLACVVAGGLNYIIAPVFNAVFPRFSALATLHDENALKHLYSAATQLTALLVLPVAITLGFFSYDLLLLWTGDALTAQNTSPIVSILVIGTAMSTFMYFPYALQLSHGWTKSWFKMSLFLLLMQVPTIIILTNHYGTAGAAWAWVAFNIIYMAIGVPLTHQKILQGQGNRWFMSLVYSFASVFAAVLIGHWLFKLFIPGAMVSLSIGTVFLLALFSASLSSQYIRCLLSNWILKGKSAC